MDNKVSVTQPAIQAKNTGIIISENGTFNFYDGKITAIGTNGNKAYALQGTVSDTPTAYNTSITDGADVDGEKTKIATLAIIAGVEAKIGRTTYPRLEDAIDAAGKTVGTDGTQVEIVLVPEVVTKSEKIVISEDKNIKLDLNGRTLNTTGSDYVIENYGKLEIVDTSDEESGKITSTTNNTIYNCSTKDEEKMYTDEQKNIDLNEIEHNSNDQYYFECEDGKLINNNRKSDDNQALDTVAAGYIKLDMTKYKGKYTLFVDAEISTLYYYGGDGYVSISNKPDNSSRVRDTTYGQFMRLTETDKKIGTTDIAGGQVYYLNFRYENGSRTSNTTTDEFKINSITIKKKQEGELTLTSGEVAIDKVGTNSNIYSAIFNEGILNVEGGKITSGSAYASGVTTLAGSTSNINGGNIRLTGSNDRAIWARGTGSLTKITDGEIHAYDGVYTSIYTGNVEITGDTLGGDCYYQIHGYGTYSSIKLDKAQLSKSSSGENIFLHVAYCDVSINDCDITNSSSSYFLNTSGSSDYNNIEIKDSRLNSSYGIYLNKYSDLIIDTCTISTANVFLSSPRENNSQIKDSTINITGNDRVISCGTGDNLTIIDTNLNNEHSTSKYEAININDGGTINIKGNSEIKSAGAPLYSNGTSKVDVNIESGTLESTNWQAIEMVNATGTITLGEKGNGVKTDTPVLKSAVSQWDVHSYRMNLKFYDGRLIGGRDKLVGVSISDIEDGYELVDIDDEDSGTSQGDGSSETTAEKEVMTLGKTQGVAEVSEGNSNNGSEYETLQSAVESCETTEGKTFTIKLLKDVNQVRQIKVKEGQNIKIDLNGHKIYAMANNTIYNEGTLEIIDSKEGEDYNLINFTGATIIYNEVTKNEEEVVDGEDTGITDKKGKLTIGKGVHIYYNASGINNEFKSAVKNAGNIIINDAQMTCNGTYVFPFENTGTAELQGGNITTNAEYNYALCNSSNGNLKVEGTVIKCNRLYSYCIYNRGQGTVEINENANIQAELSTAVYNENTGKIILNGGTVSSQRDAVFYNRALGEIEILSGTIKSEGTYSYSSYAINNYNGGTVSVKGGNITSISSAVYNDPNTNAVINIEGGTIKSTGGAAVYNTTGTANITDGNMQSSGEEAIYNRGKLNMTGGEAICTGKYGIFNDNGSCYLGSKIIENSSEEEQQPGQKQEEPNREKPKIVGKECGVYNTGTTGNFYFYDGAITGAIGKSISGNVTERESGYQIVTDIDETNNSETSTLKRIIIAKIGESADIENGEEISNISDLQKKLNSLDETKEYTVKVLIDFSIGASEEVLIKENSKVVLDLNGCTISSDVNNTIKNNGTLTIKDSTTDALGCISNGGSGSNNSARSVIKNEGSGTLKYESGTIESTGAYTYGIYNCNSGNVVITGGIITTRGGHSHGVYNRDEGTMQISNATISTSNDAAYAVANYGKKTVKVSNSDISTTYSNNSSAYGVYNDIEGTIESNENTIHTISSCAVFNNGSGTIKISDGTTSCQTTVIYNRSEGKIELVSATIMQEGNYYSGIYAINNYNGGIVSIKGGEITSVATAVYIDPNEKAVITMDGVKIKSTSGAAVYNTNGTMYIHDTIMTSEESNAIHNQGTMYMISGEATSNTKNGIYNYGGKFYLGNTEKIKEKLEGIITEDEEQTEEVSNENPKIVGKDYGVYSTGTFYYYDGLLTGATGKSINSNVTDKETEYQIIKTADAENGTETAKLEKVKIMAMDGTEYNTIKEVQSAIDSLNDNEQHTLKLIHDTYMCLSDNLTINENKNIELDLNGYILETSCDNTITNNGKLKITDGSEAKKGRMQGIAKIFVDNKNELVVDEGEYDSTNYMAVDYNNNYISKIITNTGNITWEKAKILLNLGNNYGIHNQESGTIDWKSGTIEVNQSTTHTQYGIYTNSTGGIEWDSGEISLKTTEYRSQYGVYIEKSGTINVTTMLFSNKGEGSWSSRSSQCAIYAKDGNTEKNTVNIKDFQRKVLTSSRQGYTYAIQGYNLVVNIENGNFIDLDYAINLSKSEINIKNGIFKDKINIGYNSIAQIDDGTIEGIEVYGQLTINDGKITSVATKDTDAKITMNDGSILNEDGNGVQIDYGEFILLGGTIESTNSNGVYINNSGKFIMGDNTNAVSTDVPKVNGNTYGVYVNSGEFDFYDGTITGNTKAIYGGVKNKPENYKVQYSDTEETVAFLDIDAQVEKVVSVDGVYFSDFESALDHAMNNRKGTILVHKEMDLPNSMTIDDNTDITINLNGHSLNAELADTIFINNGTLTIIDEIVDETEDGDSDSADGDANDGEEVQSVVSKIENTQGYVVINNYTLTVGRKGNELIKTTPVLKGQTTAIQNNGTFNWYDGVIDGNEITEEKTQSAIITSLARQIKAGADNMLKEAEKKILPLVQNPNIKVDKEFPIWTKGPVTATIYTTDRIILDIKNETANVETRSLTVKKVWEMPDEEAQNYKSTIQLMKIVNGKKEAVTDKKGNNLTVEIIGNHSKTFENIPVYKGKEKIEYVLEEIKVQRRTSEGEWEDVPMTDFSVTYKQMSN